MNSNHPALDIGSEEAPKASINPKDILRFLAKAARRHTLFAALVAAALAGVGTLVGIFWPPTYDASTKIIITQNALVTTGLSNPGISLPRVDPVSGVVDLMMKKETMESVTRDAHLLERWDQTRLPILRLKDKVMSFFFGPIPETEKMRAIVGVLQRQISVRPDGASITIGATWRDPQVALDLAKIAQEKFFEVKSSQELSVITAAISLLEDEVKKAAEAINPALNEVNEARNAGRELATSARNQEPALAGAPPTVVRTVRSAPAGPDPKLSAQLLEIRQAIRELQEPWQRRVAELRMQLNELRGTFGPAHPAVQQHEARIQQASQDPPGLDGLKQQEKDILNRIEKAQQGAAAQTHTVVRLPSTVPDSAAALVRTPEDATRDADDPKVQAAHAKLMGVIGKYTELNDRLDSVRLNLNAAQTAFKYRYVVVVQPELPRKPSKPNRFLIILGSLGGALLAGFVAGGIKELATGKVLEPWQMVSFGMPLLAEVNLSNDETDEE